MAYYKLKVITPQGEAYSGDVLHSEIPGEDGYVGVLANHASYVTSSPGGRLQVKEKDGTEKVFRVGVGFFEVVNNQASFFTQSLESRA